MIAPLKTTGNSLVGQINGGLTLYGNVRATLYHTQCSERGLKNLHGEVLRILHAAGLSGSYFKRAKDLSTNEMMKLEQATSMAAG